MRKQMLGCIVAIAMLPFLAITMTIPANGNSMRIVNYQSRLHVNLSGFDSNQSNGAWSMFRGSLNHTGAVKTTLTSSSAWTCTISSAHVQSSPAIASGRVYVGSEDYEIYCMNATTGAFIWSRGTGGMIISSPAIASGRVYVGSEDNKLYCMNATTGAFIWSRGTGGMIISSPAIASGRVYVGSMDSNLYCLNATTGTILWTLGTSGVISSSPAIDDGKIFFGSNDHTLYCVNATSGGLLWSYSSTNEFFSSPTIANGRVFEGCLDHNLYCLNETNGNIIWAFKTSSWIFASPAYYEDKIYIGSEDNVIYCINTTNGLSIWNYTTNGMVYSSPAISNGFLYEGSDDNNLYCLNASSGVLIWSYPMNNEVLSSPAISSGHIYVGSWDGKLYCLPMELISTAPQRLLAVSGKNKIQITWQAPVNPWNTSFKYRVYRSTAPGLETPLIILSNTSWINNGLINNQVYYYEVSAIDNMDIEGQISTEINCKPGIPSIPINLQVIGGNKAANLSWQAPMHNGGYAITGYQIYQGISPDSISMINSIQNMTNFSCTGLMNGQTYYFAVAAMNQIGAGQLTIPMTTTTLDVPGIPLSLAAKAGDSQVILNWTIPSSNGGNPIIGYNIYRGLSVSGEILYKSIGNVTSFVDTSLVNGQDYYYKISAINAVGESTLSSEVIGIPSSPSSPSSSTSIPGYQPFMILASFFIMLAFLAINFLKKRK